MTEAVSWVKWRFDHWRGDEGLRVCGLAARGLWIDLLSFMHGGKPYGHLSLNGKPPTNKQIAAMVGMTTEKEVAALLQELETNGVFSRSEDGMIKSRRLVRDNAAREKGKEYGLQGGNPLLTGNLPGVDNGSGYRFRITGGVNPPLKDRVRERKREETESESEGDSRSRRSRHLAGSLEDEHAQFWAIYPRKKEGPGACLPKFKIARKLASFETIMDGLRRYEFDPAWLPMAATWLHQKRWLTQPDTAPVTIAQKVNGHELDLTLDFATPIKDQFPKPESAHEPKRLSSNDPPAIWDDIPPIA